MNQEERTQRSRAQILNAALRLFSRQGYRATSVRDIAHAAKVSTGNVYHHFRDKQAIFRELLGQYWRAIDDPEFPINKALASGHFPEDLEEVGRAARESVERYRRYVSLIYVDVVEFEGSHIRRFYSDMAQRFETFAQRHREQLKLEGRLRPGVTPGSAMMLATRIFLNYFAVEVVFGVPHHFGKSTGEVVKEIAEVLRHGMLTETPCAASVSERQEEDQAPVAATGPAVIAGLQS
jgi:AcrR family transcriptional regulator